MYKKNNIMTNFDYIMSKMTDRNFADIFCDGNFIYDEETFGYQINKAFQKWRHSLGGYSIYFGTYDCRGNKIKFSVFEKASYTYCTIRDKFRKNNLSFQVWLGKQYNPEEWRDN